MVGRGTQGGLTCGSSVHCGPVALMRWVREVEEVRVARAEDTHTRAILRALESQMGRGAAAEEADEIKEQNRLALEWMDSCKEGDQQRWILPPGTKDGARREGLARARKIVEDGRKQGPEVEEDPEGGRQGRWRGLRRGRGGQMRLVVGDRVEEEQGYEEEGQPKEPGGREQGLQVDARVGKDGVRGKGKEWRRRKERRWTGTGGVWQGKVRRDGTTGEMPETTGRERGTSSNERRKSGRNQRGWGERRTMGGQ